MVTTEKKRIAGAKSGETRAAQAQEQAERFEALMAAGRTVQEATQELGISRSTAWRYLHPREEEPAAATSPGSSALVALEDLHDNPYQPRTTTDAAAMEELVESIAQLGVLQPPAARHTAGRWEIVWGHRRVEAVRALALARRAEGLAWQMRADGRPVIAVQVAGYTDEEMRVIALTENLKRTDLTQLEQARAFKRYVDEVPGATITGLAKRVGLDRTAISHGLRTLTLPAAALELVEKGRMAFGAARELLALACTTHGMHEDLLEKVLGSLYRSSSEIVTREQVRHALSYVTPDALHRAQGTLRLCEPKEKVYGGGVPDFDVAAFIQGHKDELHVLPTTYGGETYRYTCAVEDWTAAQRAVKREAKDNGAAKRRKEWQEMIKTSPHLAALRAEHKAEKLEGRATPAELEALGPLGQEPVTVGNVPWARSFYARGDHFDKEECRTCTKGARVLSAHGQLELHCTNRECFEKKDKEGMAVAKEKLKDHQAAEVAQCARIRQLIEGGSPNWPQVLAITCGLLTRTSGYDLLNTYRDKTPEGLDYEAVPRMVLKEIVQPKGKRVHDFDAVVQATFGSMTAEYAEALLIAVMLRVWQRSNHGLNGLEKALTAGVTQVTEEAAV